MEKKKSSKPVKALSDLLLPFEVVFPIKIEIGVNREHWVYPAGQKVVLRTYAEYETIAHTPYAKYLGH